MAKRPSVQEILAAARRGGPAPASAPEESTAPPELAVEPVETSPPEPAAEVQARVETPTPSSLGRPLTLKEKLAAARAGGSAPASAPAAAKAEPLPSRPEAPEPQTSAAAEAPPTPAAPLGRPMTLQEKLAAARAGGGGVAPAAKSAAGAPAKEAQAKAAVARTLPPLEKMTDPKDLAEAARQAGAKKGKSPAAATAEKATAAKVPPKPETPKAKPVPPKPTKATVTAPAGSMGRRAILEMPVWAWILVGWGSFVAGMATFTAMLGRFMFPNVLAEPPSTIKVGLPTQFEPGEVNERWKAEWGFWIVRSPYEGQDSIYALQSVCTHLGCPPNWLAGEQKFKCPCHGSGFYISGINFEGPAPRPLERFKIAVGDDGQIVVDKSQKYQQELGQWADPDSFLAV